MNRPRKWSFDAIDPSGPSGLKRRTLWIDQGTIEFLTRSKLTPRFYRLTCVKAVAIEPLAIFQGWNREEFDDAMCYVGRPDDHPSDGIWASAEKGKHFLAFALPSGKVEEWGWEFFDPDNPDDCQRQFGPKWRRIWPLTPLT